MQSVSDADFQSVDLNGACVDKTSTEEDGWSTAKTSPAPQNNDLAGGHGDDEPMTEVSTSCNTSLRHMVGGVFVPSCSC